MNEPTHEELAGYLRCVVYDLRVLAIATERMAVETDEALVEVFKTAALVKLRAVYDFFHRAQAADSIKLTMFDCYAPVKPTQIDREWDTWLTHQSINTYVVHLDIGRVSKAVPQPKFARGDRSVQRTAINFMLDARQFVASVMQHQDFVGLNAFGKRYWQEFIETLERLERLD